MASSKDGFKDGFTSRDVELMALAWKCIETPPKIDFQKLAELSGLKNPHSASSSWAQIKRRIACASEGDATPKAARTGLPADWTKSTNKKSASGKRGAEDYLATPSKKPRGIPIMKTRKTGTKIEDDDEDGLLLKYDTDEEVIVVKDEDDDHDGSRAPVVKYPRDKRRVKKEADKEKAVVVKKETFAVQKQTIPIKIEDDCDDDLIVL